jgi:hypothetical protein
MSRNRTILRPKERTIGKKRQIQEKYLVELTPLICIILSFSTIDVTTFMDAATFSRKLSSG